MLSRARLRGNLADAFKRVVARARCERGFTLIEVLVAMVTGLIVIGALFAILEMSARQTSRLSRVAQATQASNFVMTHIVDELHSACLSEGFTPVLEGSSANKLIFVNGYFPEKVTNTSTEPEYSFVRKDIVEYVPAQEKVSDTTYKASGEPTEGVYPWKTTSTVIPLGEKITPLEEGSEKTHVFKYWEYATASATSTSTAASTLKEIELKTESSTLTKEQASKVAAITVTFVTAPYAKKEFHLSTSSEKGVPAILSTQTTLAFSAPNSETPVTAAPCE